MKTLGIRWNAKSDIFYYTIGTINDSRTVTKRQILSVIARLFDPLGWLGPIVIVAKILMQQLWEANTNWDQAVPPLVRIKWNSFKENLPHIQTLKIPNPKNTSSDSWLLRCVGEGLLCSSVHEN